MDEERSARRRSEKAHWASFWKRDRKLDEIYDNDDRIRVETISRLEVSGYLTLEVGAATARDSVSLASEGAVPVALDYIPEALERAREASGDLLLVCGDALALPFRDGCFDMVFHQGVLEHFRDPLPILRENERVLRTEGVLLVDVPQTFHVYTLLKKPLIAINRWFAGWETQFTRRGLEDLLMKAGLRPFAAYGRFFSPSLAYRVFREVGRKLGLRLPLRPVLVPSINRIRARLRGRTESLVGPALGCVLGVFARKPTEEGDRL
jgi:ubiquinone/menaquinone biosynthesis C-methylase UbiE